MFFDDSKPSRVSMVENIHFHSHTGCINSSNQSLRGPGGHVNSDVGRPRFFKHTSLAYSKHEENSLPVHRWVGSRLFLLKHSVFESHFAFPTFERDVSSRMIFLVFSWVKGKRKATQLMMKSSLWDQHCYTTIITIACFWGALSVSGTVLRPCPDKQCFL